MSDAKRISARTRVLLMLAVFAAFVLDALFYTGFIASDDGAYLYGARDLVRGNGFDVTLASARLVIVVPDSVVLFLSGGVVEAVAWFHVLYHLALVVVAFFLGRTFANGSAKDTVGLIAALLVAISPLFYVFAGAVLPDNVFLMWVGLFLLLLEKIRQQKAAGMLSSNGLNRRSIRLHIGAGLLLGLAYSCKETALLLTVPSAICVIAAAKWKVREWLVDGIAMVAGLLAFMVMEHALLAILSGEFHLRLTLMQGTSDLLDNAMAIQGTTVVDRFGFAEAGLSAHLPISFWLMLLGSLAYVIAPGRRLMLPLFFVWSVLFLTIGSTSLSEWRPQTIQPRYFTLALLPALIMTACALELMTTKLGCLFRRFGGCGWSLVKPIGLATLLVIGVHECKVNAPISGGLYNAQYAKGLYAGLGYARDNHPGYRVIAVPWLNSRVRPQFFDGPIEMFDHKMRFSVPEPPFIYIDLDSKTLRKMKDRDGRHVKATPNGDYELQSLTKIAPPRSRIDRLKELSREVFGLTPLPVRSQSHIGAVVVQLVTKIDRSKQQHSALDQLDPRSTISRLVNGLHAVEWDSGGPFYIQFFDRRTYKAAPSALEAQLPSNPTSFTTQLGYRLARGTQVRVDTAVYGYAADKTFKIESTTTQLEAGVEVKRLSLNVTFDKPMVAYKVRIRIFGSMAGLLQVFPPTLKVEATPEHETTPESETRVEPEAAQAAP